MGQNCYPACYLPILRSKYSGEHAMCWTWAEDRRCPIVLVTLRLSTFPTTPCYFLLSRKEANNDSPLSLSDPVPYEHLTE